MLVWLTIAGPAAAQDLQGWNWQIEGNAFFGLNHQERKVGDVSEWESQNWLMAGAERRSAAARVRLRTMLSFEPFTLKTIGSPQVFQTGETFNNSPLIDYQHPHDFIMGAGGDYQRPIGVATLLVGADLVGAPALGPPPFMHRPSSSENPQAPLSHHYLDSSHITHGVLRTSIGVRAWRLDGSWFHGQEPDEHRLDLDLGKLDSYAGRVSWTRGAWAAQLSAAHLTRPERFSPTDAKRITASVAFGANAPGLSWLAAIGQNRESHGNFEGYLLEGTYRDRAASAFYWRVESVAKDILDAYHALFHATSIDRHRQSQVGAFTAGYVRNILSTPVGAFGIGADITGYSVPRNLRAAYGSPVSVHVFLRYRARPLTRSGEVHVH
jgi:hypothetical protein